MSRFVQLLQHSRMLPFADAASVDLPMPRQFARSVRVVARGDCDSGIALRVEAVVLED